MRRLGGGVDGGGGGGGGGKRRLGLASGMLVGVPSRSGRAEGARPGRDRRALAGADGAGVRGRDVTPSCSSASTNRRRPLLETSRLSKTTRWPARRSPSRCPQWRRRRPRPWRAWAWRRRTPAGCRRRRCRRRPRGVAAGERRATAADVDAGRVALGAASRNVAGWRASAWRRSSLGGGRRRPAAMVDITPRGRHCRRATSDAWPARAPPRTRRCTTAAATSRAGRRAGRARSDADYVTATPPRSAPHRCTSPTRSCGGHVVGSRGCATGCGRRCGSTVSIQKGGGGGGAARRRFWAVAFIAE